MARKKKAPGEVDESRLVMVPEVAAGSLFVDVAYEHRCHHEPHECCGVTFEPGHVITLRDIKDVPEEMLEDKLLKVRAAKMGACRLQNTLHYTPMSQPEFDVLTSQAEAEEGLRLDALDPRNAATIVNVSAEPASEVVASSDQPEGGE